MQSGLVGNLFSNDGMFEIGATPNIYLFRGNLKSTEVLSDTLLVKDLGPISVSRTSADTTFIDDTNTTLNADVDGYAIAWPISIKGRRREILFYVNKKGKAGETYTTDRLYFNFLDKPIINNNLHNSGQGGR